jgi:hypothetical protein
MRASVHRISNFDEKVKVMKLTVFAVLGRLP